MSPAETETVAWLIEQHLTDELDRLQPRHRRPQDHPRLRQHRAEPGAAEAAAGADRGRHPRRGAQHLERLEGPAAARALLRDRAGGGRRPHAARLARPRRRRPGRLPRRRRRLAGGGGRALHRPALSRLLAQDRDAQGRRALPSSCAAPSRRARSSPATSRPTPSPPSPSCRCSRPTIPRLLALFAGACAASGANISGAHISTTRDGFALDTFLLAREFDHDEDELRRARRIAETIEKLLKGEIRLSALMAKRREQAGRLGAFTVAPEVLVDNALSNQFTVIEVSGLDRPGLLFELTNTLSDLNLDITSRAHHHVRREGRRRVLRHRPHQQEDHQPAAPEGHPRAPAGRAGRGRDAWMADRSRRTPMRIARDARRLTPAADTSLDPGAIAGHLDHRHAPSFAFASLAFLAAFLTPLAAARGLVAVAPTPRWPGTRPTGRAPTCCRPHAPSRRRSCTSTPRAPAAGRASSPTTAGSWSRSAAPAPTRATTRSPGAGRSRSTTGRRMRAGTATSPTLVGAVEGPAAEALIPKIRAAVARYPYNR